MGVCGAIRPDCDFCVMSAPLAGEPVSDLSRTCANGVVNVLAETPPLTPSIIRGVGRSKISFAISLTIVAIAAATLYHLLRGIELGKVVEAIEAQSGWKILLAGSLVVAGYSNLVLYDVFALQTIGKMVHAVAGRRLHQLHELHDRPFARRGDLHLRAGPFSRLFVLGPDRHRHRQDRVHDRPDLLARQRLRARRRRCS